MAPPRVLIIEDHPLMADALRAHLESLAPQVQCVQAGNLSDGLACMATHSYALVLVDLNLPDSEGLDTLNAFCNAPVQWPMAVISALDDAQVAQTCLDNNVVYLLKSVQTSQLMADLLKLLTHTLLASISLDASLQALQAAAHPMTSLSKMQRLVLALLSQGQSSMAIAQALKVTEATVRSHMTQIYKRLGVKNRTQASSIYLRWSQQHGLFDA